MFINYINPTTIVLLSPNLLKKGCSCTGSLEKSLGSPISGGARQPDDPRRSRFLATSDKWRTSVHKCKQPLERLFTFNSIIENWWPLGGLDSSVMSRSFMC